MSASMRVMAAPVLAMASMVLWVGCAMPRPTVQCQLDLACDAVVEAASSLLPAGEATWVITPGRSPAGSTHAEVHACYPDGRYLLIDVFEGIASGASVRTRNLPDPPCR